MGLWWSLWAQVGLEALLVAGGRSCAGWPREEGRAVGVGCRMRLPDGSQAGLLTTNRKAPALALPQGLPALYPYTSSHCPDALAEATLLALTLLLVLCESGMVLLAHADALVKAGVRAHWVCSSWGDAEAPAARVYLTRV